MRLAASLALAGDNRAQAIKIALVAGDERFLILSKTWMSSGERSMECAPVVYVEQMCARII
jgi:hypothetical protein